jgi:nitroreductase
MKLKTFIMACMGILAVISCKHTDETSLDMKNEVIEAIMNRRAIRVYKPERVEPEVLEKIIECGVNAPSALNKQSWEIRVVNNLDLLDEIKDALVASNPDCDPAEVRDCFRQARTVLFIANDTTFPISAIDCGIFVQNIMLSAYSLGVGSVCLGRPIPFLENCPEVMSRLDFSEGYKPVICVGLGYPDETPTPKPRDFSKVRYIK